MKKDLRLRNGFDQFAEAYDTARPGYPEKLFEVLVKKTGIDKNSKLLEIAPGTGQATLPLARRGFNIIAVELGSNLAKIARNNLRNYPDVKIITGAFEGVDLPPGYFDLVYAATAFHWISSEMRFKKSYELLKQNGFLAVINSSYISDEKGDQFFYASQPIYGKYFSQSKMTRVLCLDEIKPAELNTEIFQLTHFQCFPRTISYTTEEYCQLISTDSEKIALPQDKRKAFFKEIEILIKSQFGGKIERRYANSLTIAKKIAKNKK